MARPSDWELESSPKLSRLLPRVVPAAVTFDRARVCMPRVPVTRLSDLTPLDPLRLPAYCAVTPLARDLTTHLGKGLTAEAARAGALMEAIERASAEGYAGTVRRASHAELVRERAADVVDPLQFDLPDDSAYRPRRRCAWIEAHDLLRDGTAFMPLDLAINPPAEGILREVDTNGLASGNTWLEAVVHGLCEVIERDAISQLLFAALFGGGDSPELPRVAPLDLRTLPASAAAWRDRIEDGRLSLSVQAIFSDLGVATFRCLLEDPAYPSPAGEQRRAFAGYGTDPCAELALLRAISEAVQARLAVVQGARDSFNRLPGRAPALASDGHALDFGDVASFECEDVRDDLRFLLARLRASGFERALVADLTQPALAIPVVRVRVPGAACFVVNRRRIGWRCLRHLV